MKHSFIAALLAAATAGTFVNAQQTAESAPAPAFYQNFDKWEWMPIDARHAKMYQNMKKNNYPICVEIDGGTVRAIPQWDKLGIMVSGKDAFKENSLRLITGPNNDFVWGYHTSKIRIKPDKEYTYEVYLKGKGHIYLGVWLEGINAQGKKGNVGLVPMFNIRVNNPEWTKFTGTWSVPPNKNAEYSKYENGFMWGLCINKNSDICIDELKLFESDKKQ